MLLVDTILSLRYSISEYDVSSYVAVVVNMDFLPGCALDDVDFSLSHPIRLNFVLRFDSYSQE